MKSVLVTLLCLALAVALVSGQDKNQEKTAVDVMPAVKTRSMPVYPEAAKEKKLEGKVYLNVLVDAKGLVEKVEVLKTDAQLFNEPAIKSARAWTFDPARKNGKPVAAWVTIPFQFKLAADSVGGKK